MSAARCTSSAFGQPARSATSTRRSELELLGAPTTISRSHAAGDGLDRRLAVGGGVADVFLVRPDDAGKALPQDGDDRGRVVDRQGGLRDVGEPLGVARRRSARASAAVSISVTAPAGSWPMVPITSGWPAWPIRTISRPLS